MRAADRPAAARLLRHAARPARALLQLAARGAGPHRRRALGLRDALLGVAIPFIEVHLSNVHAREDFRQTSYLSDVAVGVITGLGAKGYEYAVDRAAAICEEGA